MTLATLHTLSANQVAAGYLATIASLPREARLDQLAAVLASPIDTELRRPLLREFNDLMEGETNG